ncbi:hypothetical protein BJ742DRAFT_913639 [Cladochytrium replicatum]|nr:hypothetical protein BJ742DRAFT_913639 [Cladochytrium replicatum]
MQQVLLIRFGFGIFALLGENQERRCRIWVNCFALRLGVPQQFSYEGRRSDKTSLVDFAAESRSLKDAAFDWPHYPPLGHQQRRHSSEIIWRRRFKSSSSPPRRSSPDESTTTSVENSTTSTGTVEASESVSFSFSFPAEPTTKIEHLWMLPTSTRSDTTTKTSSVEATESTVEFNRSTADAASSTTAESTTEQVTTTNDVSTTTSIVEAASSPVTCASGSSTTTLCTTATTTYPAIEGSESPSSPSPPRAETTTTPLFGLQRPLVYHSHGDISLDRIKRVAIRCKINSRIN